MSKKISLTIIILYQLSSFIILDIFNHGKDFYLLSKWSLFNKTKLNVHDITWDDGNSYLFRDHGKKFSLAGGDLKTLFFRTNQYDVKYIKQKSAKLYKICDCQKIELYKLDGSLSDHIIFKKKNKVLHKVLL